MRVRLANVFLAGTADWIPAFAGMTNYCRRGIVFLYADSSAIPPLFVRGIQFLHTLESGNPEAAVRNVGPLFLTETPQQIPAFAGMTSTCKAVRFLHTLESGNPEAAVRNVGPVLLTETPQRDSRFRGNDE